MLSGRWCCAAVSLGPNKVVLVGGSRDSNVVDLLTFDNTWNWRRLTPMNEGHSTPGIAHLNGKVIVVGGQSKTVEMLNSATLDGQWTNIAPLGEHYMETFLVTFSGRLVVFGRFSGFFSHICNTVGQGKCEELRSSKQDELVEQVDQL